MAKSTHAGIPWLRFISRELGERVRFWPFDGWDIPQGKSAIAEVYRTLWSRSFARNGRAGDQHEAFTIAVWLWCAYRDGSLEAFLNPNSFTCGWKCGEGRGLNTGRSRLDPFGRRTRYC